ncbi:outer membrane protein assembly factor BamB family protein [Streptomyces bohaiensis]|uniref:PQQ-binding-like beta-propeller repeat protein n=1 Tax=Streptomyces bohaiensis TaxID=1431344 RepID=A0ABX1CGB0_9ACTN|nr:PQQ-binding-like beta-propeller repeat protein [Streptomyces bohaiensis]NJQ16948.1 PQQ-binding-like beta-propeller repeat protein [Streptomyces bohaiensis]
MRTAAFCLAGALALAGCSSDDGPSTDDRRASSAGEEEPAGDTRVSAEFAADPTLTLSEHYAGLVRAVLDADTAFVSDHGGLTAYALDDGAERFRVEPAAPGVDAYGPDDIPEDEGDRQRFSTDLVDLPQPQLTEVDGRDVLLAAHLVEADGNGVRGSLMGVDAATGEELWNLELDPEHWRSDPFRPALTLSAAHDGHVVVTSTNGDFLHQQPPLTRERHVVDLATGEIVRELEDTLIGHVDGVVYTAVGSDGIIGGTLVAADAVDGEVLWELDVPDQGSAVLGPWLLLTDWDGLTQGDGQLLRLSDREVVLDRGEGPDAARGCIHDDESAVTACTLENELIGIDADGAVIWSIPTDGGWVSPEPGNGYLYGRPDGTPLAIDAATGEIAAEFDRDPETVGPTGVLQRDGNTLTFHAFL